MSNVMIYDLSFKAAVATDEVEIQATSAGVSYKTTVASISTYVVSQVSSGVVTGALGYTPVNRAGDTMTGTLNLPTNGFTVGTTQLIATGGNVGIGASPSVDLDVNKSKALGSTTIRVYNPNTTVGSFAQVQCYQGTIQAKMVAAYTSSYFGSTSNHECNIITNDIPRVTIQAGGDVIVTQRIGGTNLHNNASGMAGATYQHIGSGTYTPTLTVVSNCSGESVSGVFRYIRVGNIVEVKGNVILTTTAATTATQLDISLPIASSLAASTDLSGNGSCLLVSAATYPGFIRGDATNDRASFYIYSHAASSNTYSVSFSYEVK